MCGGDLVQMIRKLFTAVDNGGITTLEPAYVRLEKQMYMWLLLFWVDYRAWVMMIELLCNEHHLNAFGRQCKIDSCVGHVTQYLSRKRNKKQRRSKGLKNKSEGWKKCYDKSKKRRKTDRLYIARKNEKIERAKREWWSRGGGGFHIKFSLFI